MSPKIRTYFLLLVLMQGLHSVEEYSGKLWNVFPTARFLTGMISADHRQGFIIINITLFLFGILCWLFTVRMGLPAAKQLISFWLVIELINGIGHPLWSVLQWSYSPGLVTALILLFLSIRIIILLLHPQKMN